MSDEIKLAIDRAVAHDLPDVANLLERIGDESKTPVAHIHRSNDNMVNVFFAGGVCPIDGNSVSPEFIESLPMNKSVPLYIRPQHSDELTKLREERDALIDRWATLRDERNALRSERDALKASDLAMQEMYGEKHSQCDELRCQLASVEQERDALAATVEQLRSAIKPIDNGLLDETQDPSAILAARDARVRAQALVPLVWLRDQCHLWGGEAVRAATFIDRILADEAEKGGA